MVSPWHARLALLLTLFHGGLSTAEIHPRNIRPKLHSESLSTNVSRGPYDVDPAVWARLMQKNQVAWGDFPVIGPDTRQPFPGTESLNWTVSIDIATNISLQYSNMSRKFSYYSDIPYNYSAYISGAAMSLQPPTAIFNGTGTVTKDLMHSSWKVCAYTYVTGVLFPLNRDEGLPSDACSRISTDKCLDAVSQEIQRSISENDWAGDGGCPRLTALPGNVGDVCPQYGTEYSIPITSFAWSSNKSHSAFSAWDIPSVRNRLDKLKDLPDEDILSGEPAYYNGSAIFQWASDWGDQGNRTLLDDVGYDIPVFLLWGYNKDSVSEDVDSTGVRLDFQCVKAEHKAEYLDHIPGSASHGIMYMKGWYIAILFSLFFLI